MKKFTVVRWNETRQDLRLSDFRSILTVQEDAKVQQLAVGETAKFRYDNEVLTVSRTA